MEYYAVTTYDGLYHHGIKGQHWGVRRFQNEDGSVTAAGARRYYTNGTESQQKVGQKRMALDKAKADYKSANKQYNQSFKEYYKKSGQYYSLNKNKRKANMERFNKAMADGQKVNQAKANYKEAKKAYRVEKKAYKAEEKAAQKENAIANKPVKGLSDSHKKALKVGAAVAGTALAVYGAKKVRDYVNNEHVRAVHENYLQNKMSFELSNKNATSAQKAAVERILQAHAEREYNTSFANKVRIVAGNRRRR